jgi:hypothetical protein
MTSWRRSTRRLARPAPPTRAALVRAEELGGRRALGPEGVPGALVVGRFCDPEGNVIGVAGTA